MKLTTIIYFILFVILFNCNNRQIIYNDSDRIISTVIQNASFLDSTYTIIKELQNRFSAGQDNDSNRLLCYDGLSCFNLDTLEHQGFSFDSIETAIQKKRISKALYLDTNNLSTISLDYLFTNYTDTTNQIAWTKFNYDNNYGFLLISNPLIIQDTLSICALEVYSKDNYYSLIYALKKIRSNWSIMFYHCTAYELLETLCNIDSMGNVNLRPNKIVVMGNCTLEN